MLSAILRSPTAIEVSIHKVIGAAMAVHRHFGSGYLEEVYKNALMIELDELGIKAEKEVACKSC